MQWSSFIIRLLSRISGQNIIFPFYHTVSNNELPHLKHLYKTRSLELFEGDIKFLINNFKPLTAFDLIKIANGSKQIDHPSFFLSFDDGLREVYSKVKPILEKYKVPATAFLNSAFVDNKDLFYRYKASILIERFAQSSVLTEYFGYDIDFNEFKQKVLSINYNQREELDRIAEVMHIDFNDYLEKQKPYLSSYEIKELINCNFTFGAHSIDHPDFHIISNEERIHQVKESTAFIQSEFAIDYKLFSFPFFDHNIEKPFFKDLKNLEIDLSFGVSGIKVDEINTNFQRIPVEKSNGSMQKQIIWNYIYFIIKRLLGKHKMKRN